MADTPTAAAAIHPVYEFLKDFQPTLAALVAFLVAVIAYRGAMAKVKFDREIDSRTQRGISLALSLRLEAQLAAILPTAGTMAMLTERAAPNETESMSWQRSFYWDFDLSSLEEAWQQLDRIPTPGITLLASLRGMDQLINTIDDHSRDDGAISRGSALIYAETIQDFADSAQRLLDIIRPEIERLRES